MPIARFFFDYGSGTVLWMAEPRDPDDEYFVDIEQLPISEELRKDLRDLLVEYDSSLNWASPADPGPWREPRCRRFNADARAALGRLREELQPEWQIIDRFTGVHEDPDLDRYLENPAGFGRKRGRLDRIRESIRRR